MTDKTYLRRARLFVNTEERDMIRSKDQFEFVLPLDNTYEQVVSIELVDYAISKKHERYFRREGLQNNQIIIYLEDKATHTHTLRLTVTIPSHDSTGSWVEDVSLMVQTQINNALDACGDAYYAGNTRFVVTCEDKDLYLGVPRKFIFACEYIGYGFNMIDVSFLFAETPNSMAKLLGFEEENITSTTFVREPFTPTMPDPMGVEQPSPPTITVCAPVPSHLPTLTIDRYLDVSIREFPELTPVARLSLTHDLEFANVNPFVLYKRNFRAVKGVRLLREPVRRLSQLSVDIRLPNGQKPPLTVHKGVDLVFDILMIAKEQQIPAWMRQVMAY